MMQTQILRELLEKDGWKSGPVEIDTAKLWDDLKADLEREAIGSAESQSMGFKAIGGFGRSRAQACLERMLQMEAFARVKADMRGHR